MSWGTLTVFTWGGENSLRRCYGISSRHWRRWTPSLPSAPFHHKRKEITR